MTWEKTKIEVPSLVMTAGELCDLLYLNLYPDEIEDMCEDLLSAVRPVEILEPCDYENDV